MAAEIQQWGKYRIRRLIAKGGMAEVYEAEILGPAGFAKPVCLKRIRPELTADTEFVQMFEAEARIAARLHHPNIVSVFDFDRHDGQMFLTMEYVDGCDLKQIIQEAGTARLSIPVAFAVHVMDGLLAALDHAHTGSADGKTQPVIHRDVSPHNVLLSKDGTVKLADFGIAKSRGLSDATQVGVIKGKPAYLAPEQMDGRVSPSSDLFGAGLVLHETLTGKRAVRPDNNMPLAARLATFEYIPVPWFSDKLNGFLSILLARDPHGRFASADAARTALKALEIPPLSEKEAAALVQSAVRLKHQRLALERADAKGALPRISRIETRFSTTPSGDRPVRSGEAEEEDPAPTPASPASKAPKRRRFAPLFLVVAALFAVGVGILALARKGRTDLEAAPTPTTSVKEDAHPSSSPKAADGNASPRRSADTPKPPSAPTTAIEKNAPGSTGSGAEHEAVEAKIVRLTEPPVPEENDTESPSNGHEEKSASPKRGSLNVNVRPWAEVYVDGTSRGTTPIHNLALRAGTHELRIENKPLGYNEALKIQIRRGKTVVLNRTIQK